MVSRTQDSGQVTVRAIIGNTVMKLSFSCLIRGFRKKKKKKKKKKAVVFPAWIFVLEIWSEGSLTKGYLLLVADVFPAFKLCRLQMKKPWPHSRLVLI